MFILKTSVESKVIWEFPKMFSLAITYGLHITFCYQAITDLQVNTAKFKNLLS